MCDHRHCTLFVRSANFFSFPFFGVPYPSNVAVRSSTSIGLNANNVKKHSALKSIRVTINFGLEYRMHQQNYSSATLLGGGGVASATLPLQLLPWPTKNWHTMQILPVSSSLTKMQWQSNCILRDVQQNPTEPKQLTVFFLSFSRLSWTSGRKTAKRRTNDNEIYAPNDQFTSQRNKLNDLFKNILHFNFCRWRCWCCWSRNERHRYRILNEWRKTYLSYDFDRGADVVYCRHRREGISVFDFFQ